MSSNEVTWVTDASLVVAIARCRREALAEVYRRHGGGVFGMARRLLGDGESARDIAQEVFLRLWRQPERFDPSQGSLRTCLLAETHGRSVALLRSETARRRREELDVRTATDMIDDVERHLQDLAVEIARLLGESESTVKCRIRTGLRRLRLPLTRAGLV